MCPSCVVVFQGRKIRNHKQCSAKLLVNRLDAEDNRNGVSCVHWHIRLHFKGSCIVPLLALRCPPRSYQIRGERHAKLQERNTKRDLLHHVPTSSVTKRTGMAPRIYLPLFTTNHRPQRWNNAIERCGTHRRGRRLQFLSAAQGRILQQLSASNGAEYDEVPIACPLVHTRHVRLASQ